MKQMYSSESADINMSITKSIHVVLRNLDRKSECYQDLADFVIKNTQKSGNKTVDFIKYRLVSYICEKSGISAKKTCHIFEADEMTKEEISDIYLQKSQERHELDREEIKHRPACGSHAYRKDNQQPSDSNAFLQSAQGKLCRERQESFGKSHALDISSARASGKK